MPPARPRALDMPRYAERGTSAASAAVAGGFIPTDDDVLELPCIVGVPEQVLPVSFVLRAQLTTPKLLLQRPRATSTRKSK